MTIERKEMIQEQFEQLMNNEQFCAELAKATTAEAASTLLAGYGVAMTVEEVNELAREGLNNMAAYAEHMDDELAEDQLEAVVGGGKFWRMVGAIGGAVVVGGTLGLISGACPAFTPVAYKIGTGYAFAAGMWVYGG